MHGSRQECCTVLFRPTARHANLVARPGTASDKGTPLQQVSSSDRTYSASSESLKLSSCSSSGAPRCAMATGCRFMSSRRCKSSGLRHSGVLWAPMPSPGSGRQPAAAALEGPPSGPVEDVSCKGREPSEMQWCRLEVAYMCGHACVPVSRHGGRVLVDCEAMQAPCSCTAGESAPVALRPAMHRLCRESCSRAQHDWQLTSMPSSSGLWALSCREYSAASSTSMSDSSL